MFVLVLLLVFGSVFAYLAVHNTEAVTLVFGQYTLPNIPLFYVMIGSMLIGVFLAYVVYLIHTISAAMAIHGRDKKIKDAETQVAELTKEIHKLELENAKLRKDSDKEEVDNESL